jgi:hypothetical protein
MTNTDYHPHRSKVLVAWLAGLLGVFGAHWWYLKRRGAWAITSYTVLMLVLSFTVFDSWWDNPAFLSLNILFAAGFIESAVFALKPDEAFDARYNPNSGQVTRTGWNAVIVAILATFLGGTVVVAGIAMTVMHVYIAMGWLDGLVI